MPFGIGSKSLPGNKDYGIRITGEQEIIRLLREWDKDVINTTTKKLGPKVRGYIYNRTRKGKSWTGKSFQRYSPKYARHRAQTGRTTRVNLTYNRNLIKKRNINYRSIVRSGRIGVRFFYANTFLDLIASVHEFKRLSGNRKGRFVMPERQFFNVSASEIRELEIGYIKDVDKFLQKFS